MPDKVRAVIVGAIIAALGALTVSIPMLATDAETVGKLGMWAPWAGAIASILVNVLRKVVETLQERKKQLER